MRGRRTTNSLHRSPPGNVLALMVTMECGWLAAQAAGVGGGAGELEKRSASGTTGDRMRRLLLTISLGVVFGIVSFAQPGRFATEQELIGYWEMIPIPNAEEINQVDPWPTPYQWFAFYDDGTFATMGSTEYESRAAKELEEVFSILKESRFKWEFEPSGLLIVTSPSIPGYEEAWGVNLITEEAVLGEMEVKIGDLLMTLAGGEDGGPVYFRHLRRVK